MRLVLSWLREFVDVTASPDKIAAKRDDWVKSWTSIVL